MEQEVMSGFSTILVTALLLLGVMFSLLAGVGVLRMPDAYMRMQAATKAGTLGVACVALAAAVQFGNLAIAVEALLIVAFFFLTAPVAAHLIARAGFAARVKMWDRTLVEQEDGSMGSPPQRSDSEQPPNH
jgi:multicomponent Na+:H+ antiporter subunit G